MKDSSILHALARPEVVKAFCQPISQSDSGVLLCQRVSELSGQPSRCTSPTFVQLQDCCLCCGFQLTVDNKKHSRKHVNSRFADDARQV